MLPYTFMSIPPERYHFVDLQSSSSIGTTAACAKSAVLHFRQEVFGKRTTYIVLIAILKKGDKNHVNQAHKLM